LSNLSIWFLKKTSFFGIFYDFFLHFNPYLIISINNKHDGCIFILLIVIPITVDNKEIDKVQCVQGTDFGPKYKEVNIIIIIYISNILILLIQ